MNATALFEDFAHGPRPYSNSGASTEDALESFDKGYKAGWDDAAKAHAESQDKASSILVRNLETFEFTLTESRAMVLASLMPVFQEIAQTLLPSLSAEALKSQLVAEIGTLLSDAVANKLTIKTSLADENAIRSLVETGDFAEKVAIEVSDTLGEGQVRLNVQDVTHLIDITKAIDDIKIALSDLDSTFPEIQQEHANAG